MCSPDVIEHLQAENYTRDVQDALLIQATAEVLKIMVIVLSVTRMDAFPCPTSLVWEMFNVV